MTSDSPRDLVVVVPSRGRPHHLPTLIEAWHATGAFQVATLQLVVDGDDPTLPRYLSHRDAAPGGDAARICIYGTWQSMVDKLNRRALYHAGHGTFAVGFAGDDHLPITHGWAHAYLHALREAGTGIVYGDDTIHGEALPTQWAMTSDIIRAVGHMVPAPVEHLFCDNAVRHLGAEAGCLRYLPGVVIQHRHPTAGTAPWDDGYATVNSPDQYARDEETFRAWRDTDAPAQIAAVRALRTPREVSAA